MFSGWYPHPAMSHMLPDFCMQPLNQQGSVTIPLVRYEQMVKQHVDLEQIQRDHQQTCQKLRHNLHEDHRKFLAAYAQCLLRVLAFYPRLQGLQLHNESTVQGSIEPAVGSRVSFRIRGAVDVSNDRPTACFELEMPRFKGQIRFLPDEFDRIGPVLADWADESYPLPPAAEAKPAEPAEPQSGRLHGTQRKTKAT